MKKSKLIWILALVPAVALLQGATFASGTGAGAEHSMVKVADVKWGDPPPALPKGARFAVLSGDPNQPGPFTIRIKAPAGFKIARHWHPADERVTIIDGDFHLSMGDAGSMHDADFAPGDFVNLPAKMQHEATTKNGVIVQVDSTGPFEITYVDPKDDPRTAASGAQGSK